MENEIKTVNTAREAIKMVNDTLESGKSNSINCELSRNEAFKLSIFFKWLQVRSFFARILSRLGI